MSKLRLALPSLVLAVIAAVYIWTAYSYDAESRAMPRAVAGLALVLLALDALTLREDALGRWLRRVLIGKAQPTTPGLDGQAGVRHPPMQELAAFGWIAGFLILVIAFGFYIAIPIYVFSYLKFYAGKSVMISAIVALALLAFLYGIFELALGYHLYAGLLAGDFL